MVGNRHIEHLRVFFNIMLVTGLKQTKDSVINVSRLRDGDIEFLLAEVVIINSGVDPNF